MTQTTRDPIEHVAYELLRAANLDALPEEAKAEFVRKIRDEAQRRMGAIALERLDAAGLDEFHALLAQDPPLDAATMHKFFIERIPDFENVMRTGLLVFADDFLAAAQSPSRA
ncbi:MAG: DUF5663 domain-containing protein [Candidatus Uhrbacteria bacterium]